MSSLPAATAYLMFALLMIILSSQVTISLNIGAWNSKRLSENVQPNMEVKNVLKAGENYKILRVFIIKRDMLSHTVFTNKK